MGGRLLLFSVSVSWCSQLKGLLRGKPNQPIVQVLVEPDSSGLNHMSFTSFTTLVNSMGALERPNGRALN